MGEDKIVRKLRLQLEAALAKQRDDLAISLLAELIAADPKAPRWPHKLGDIHRKRQRRKEAIDAYSTAADLYFDQGFLARAVAMAKTVVDLDPRRLDVLGRIDPSSVGKLQPSHTATLAGHPALHPSVVADVSSSVAKQGPALESAEVEERHRSGARAQGERARHPSVIFEDSNPPPATHLDDVRENIPTRARRAPEAPRPPALPPPQPVRNQRGAVRSVADLAPELTAAPDAQPGEFRFSDAPEAMAINVDLSEFESDAHEQPPPSPAPDSVPVASTPERLARLPLFPLFAEIPKPALLEMVRDAELIELEDGALVIHKGEAADALYGIIEGSVEVLVPGQARQQTLTEGEVFGEACLLADEKRHADIVVRGRLLALKFPRQLFARVASAHPRLTELVLDLLTRRLLGNLLQSSPVFQEFDAAGHQQLIARFEIRRAARGTVLAELGKMSDGLYLNLTGTLEVAFADGRPIEHREAGTFFGQASLLTREPSDVRVRALSNMLVLRLPGPGFQSFAMQYPAMLAHLSTLAASNVAPVDA